MDTQTRCDKVVLLKACEYDAAQTLIDAVRSTYAALSAAAGIEIPFNVRVLAADIGAGTRTYELDTYGAGADVVLRSLPPEWYDYVSRLDYRITTEVDTDRLFEFARHIERFGRYGRNVQYFNTRPRKKTEGRHAGGKGVAVGSHKSDQRVVVYRKPEEQGAIEMHITGKALRSTIETAKALVAKGASFEWYDAVMSVMLGRLTAVVRQMSFDDVDHLIAAVGPVEDVQGLSEDEQQIAKELQAIVDRMTAPERRATARMLGFTKKDF